MGTDVQARRPSGGLLVGGVSASRRHGGRGGRQDRSRRVTAHGDVGGLGTTSLEVRLHPLLHGGKKYRELVP